jgi:hypothetical protein
MGASRDISDEGGGAFTGESTRLVQLREPDAELIRGYLKNERDFMGDEIDTMLAALEEALESNAPIAASVSEA